MFNKLNRFLTASIRRRLVFNIAMIHALLMSIFVYDLVHREQAFLQRQTLSQAQGMAETLAANAVPWVLANDLVGLEEVISAQERYEHLFYAMVLSPEGKILAHSDRQRVGKYTVDPVSRKLLAGAAVSRQLVINEWLADVAAPIFANERHIGWARIAVDHGIIDQQLRIITRNGLIYTLLAIGAGIVLAILTSHGMTLELQRLVQAAERFLRGEHPPHLQSRRHDEIGTLTTTFSRMLDAIEERERERDAAHGQLEAHRNSLEEEVDARTRELKEINHELESFSYSISHDLRAPLRGINGFSNLLLRKYDEELDDIGRDYLQRIHRASIQMGELIDEILALSRLSRSEMKHQAVDLSEMARQSVERMRSSQPERQVEVTIHSTPPVEADTTLMGVVLDNLLGNAWKFTGRAEHARIEFGNLENNGVPVFYVKDNGAGFNMAYVDKLFGLFQRLHSAEEFEGTGIGLASVKRILNRHGGAIWAEAAEDKGASFYFTVQPG